MLLGLPFTSAAPSLIFASLPARPFSCPNYHSALVAVDDLL
jgi:hypothetical protein